MLPKDCIVLPKNAKSLLRGRLERHGPLSDAAHAALQRIPMTAKKLEFDSYIVREADAPSVCGILVSGFAYRQKVTGQGIRQIVSVSTPGDIVDLQNLYLDVADHSVQMLTDGEVLTFPRVTLQQIAEEEPTVARAILIESLLEASILREWIVNIGRRNAKVRLAHLLCEFAVRLVETAPSLSVEYELPMNQEHLGDALGLTSVHLNRMLRELGDEGLVRRTKKSIMLPDWPKLKAIGDFNSRYLHLEQTSKG